MSSQTDFLTTQKNGVVALNNIGQALTGANTRTDFYAGQYTTAQITANTLVSAGSGYLTNVAIIVAGVAGTINDAATIAGAGAGNAIYPTVATVGFTSVGMRFTNGLVVLPGAGQTVVVTYSLD